MSVGDADRRAVEACHGFGTSRIVIFGGDAENAIFRLFTNRVYVCGWPGMCVVVMALRSSDV
jgi:hypothetical protein